MLQITGFSIEALNDVFNYQDREVKGSRSDLIILYGDNGSGKTTVLHLVFHLLSSEGGRGHLNAIARVPFKSLRVHLSDGTVVSTEREDGVQSLPLVFRVKRPGAKDVEYRFIPERTRDRFIQERIERELLRTAHPLHKDKRKKTAQYTLLTMRETLVPNSGADAHTKYLAALKELGITCYLMATDRRIKSDSIEEKKITARSLAEVERDDDDVITRIRTQYLKDALASASRYINRQLIRASNTGSKNTNDIYTEIIKRIAIEDATATKDVSSSLEHATMQLTELQKSNERLSRLGLAPELNVDALIPAIRSATDSNKAVLDKILRPYIDSLTARLRALDPIGDVIQTFLQIFNELFKLKSVRFSPAHGFSTHGPNDQRLEVEQLSSGEQQLLLMFCYLLVSNEHSSIFMIDEPEISLNVKWQRELIDAMRRITKGSNNQIVIATHSIELLTQYSDMVVDLDPTLSNTHASVHELTKEED